MYILIVQARVKAEFIDAFKQATAINAASSAKEPGIAGFDFLQQQDDPQKFVLYEVYRDPSAPAKHKETGGFVYYNPGPGDKPITIEAAKGRVRDLSHKRMLQAHAGKLELMLGPHEARVIE